MKKISLSNTRRIICFVGMDGSGKSTQANLLAKHLRNKKIDIGKVHFLKPFLKIFSKKNKLPKKWKPEKKLKSIFKSILIIGNTVMIFIFKFLPCIIKHKYIICDRHVIDVIAYLKINKRWNIIPSFILRFLFFKPDITFVFLIDPYLSKSRKQLEFTEDYYQNLSRIYSKILTDNMKNLSLVYIDKKLNIQQTHKFILGTLHNKHIL